MDERQRALADRMFGRYASVPPPGRPDAHPPAVVLIVHPLLPVGQFVDALVTASGGLFIQSAGRATYATDRAPLVDRLFSYLSSTPHAEDMMPLDILVRGFCLETQTARVEQLAARAAISDHQMAVQHPTTYLQLCTRNSAQLHRQVNAMQRELEAINQDTPSPGAEYSREWYTHNYGSSGAHMTLDLHMSVAAHIMTPQQNELVERRQWNTNASGIEGLHQIEVLVGDPLCDVALADAIGATLSPVSAALHRAESLQRTLLYDQQNTLYVVVAPNRNFTRAALACTHAWMTANENTLQLNRDQRAALITRLAAVLNGSWDRTLEMLDTGLGPAQRVLRINASHTPAVRRDMCSTPSQWIQCEWLPQLVSSAVVESLIDMVSGVGRSSPVAGAQWAPVPATDGRLEARVDATRPLYMNMDVRDNTSGTPVESITEGYRRLWNHEYTRGEFYTMVEERTALLREQGYESVGGESDGVSSLLLVSETMNLLEGPTS